MQLSHKNLTPRDDQRKLRNDYEDVSRLKITRYEHIQQVASRFFTREKKQLTVAANPRQVESDFLRDKSIRTQWLK